jgi:hypothetical protein
MVNLDNCVLKIMYGDVCIHTDAGIACIEVDPHTFPINYGKNRGPHSNSWFVANKIFEAVNDFLSSHEFEMSVVHIHEHEVRFKLKPQTRLPILRLSSHFDTSRFSFDRAVQKEAIKQRRIQKILRFRERPLQKAA